MKIRAKVNRDIPQHGELYYQPIGSLEQRFAQGSLTSRRLTALFVERIGALDQRGFSIHAVIELNPDALEIASTLDHEPVRGPLHGIFV